MATSVVPHAGKVSISGWYEIVSTIVSFYVKRAFLLSKLLLIIDLFQGCGYSLWHLEPSMRKNWLTSVLVIAYKYNYSPDTTIGDKMVSFGVYTLLHIKKLLYNVIKSNFY